MKSFLLVSGLLAVASPFASGAAARPEVVFADDFSSGQGWSIIDEAASPRNNYWYSQIAGDDGAAVYQKDSKVQRLVLKGTAWAFHDAGKKAQVVLDPSFSFDIQGENTSVEYANANGFYKVALLVDKDTGYAATINIATGALALFRIDKGLAGPWVLLSRNASAPAGGRGYTFSVTGGTVTLSNNLGGSVSGKDSVYRAFSVFGIGMNQDSGVWQRTAFVKDVKLTASGTRMIGR